MLLANETVATLSRRSRHAQPVSDPRAARRAEGGAVRGVHFGFGYSLAAPPGAVRPRHFQRLLEKLRGKPEERPIAFLMLRTMQKARYAPQNLGHFGLAADSYTHFTSPIRRYPDLVVHRMLREVRHQGDRPERVEELEPGPAARSRATAQRWSGAPTKPSASWCSGRRCVSWPTRSATSSTATSPASPRSPVRSAHRALRGRPGARVEHGGRLLPLPREDACHARREHGEGLSTRPEGSGSGGAGRHGTPADRSSDWWRSLKPSGPTSAAAAAAQQSAPEAGQQMQRGSGVQVGRAAKRKGRRR